MCEVLYMLEGACLEVKQCQRAEREDHRDELAADTRLGRVQG